MDSGIGSRGLCFLPLVDYRHSDTGASPLMVAAARGFITQMEQLLSMGADINMKASNGW